MEAPTDHQLYMAHCLGLARLSASLGEAPVGACVVLDGEIIGEGHNAPIAQHDPTAHAEICALRAAGQRMRNYRLPGAWLYVTIEPCAMCAGALVHARIAGLVFGAKEPRAGAVVSTATVLDNPSLNHRTQWQGGILADEAGALMKSFFLARRASI